MQPANQPNIPPSMYMTRESFEKRMENAVSKLDIANLQGRLELYIDQNTAAVRQEIATTKVEILQMVDERFKRNEQVLADLIRTQAMIIQTLNDHAQVLAMLTNKVDAIIRHLGIENI